MNKLQRASDNIPIGNLLLEVENLRVRFGDEADGAAVLKGISFSVASGETLGIVGESGSGKTMTALAISSLLPPGAKRSSAGLFWRTREGARVDLASAPSSLWGALRGKEIGFIFQDPGASLNPVWPCGEQITEVLRRHKGLTRAESRQRALEWLDRVGLPAPERIFRAFPHELSGGQKQRVMIAAALCAHPQLLIADEPTTALDATVQRRILTLIQELKTELGITILFISHNLNLVGEIADRVMVMRGGQILEEGSAASIFSEPVNPYTRGLLLCSPKLSANPPRLPLVPGMDEEPFADMLPRALPWRSVPAQAVATPLLEVQNLRVRFPLHRERLWSAANWLEALKGVSFSMNVGETLGVVGESGSGKTTLSRALLGLVEPYSGQIRYGDMEVTAVNRSSWMQLRKELQIVFQDPFATLNPRQRIEDALLEPMLVHQIGADLDERRERVRLLMRRVGLSETLLGRYPHALSGGQRQRVSIARAMAVEPVFLICDEPVSSLDVSVQAMVLNVLKDIQEEFQLTCLFISHDLAVVRFMSDRILVMQDGLIVESGVAAQVIENPQNAYTKALIAATPGHTPM